jgi:hypothetical protein
MHQLRVVRAASREYSARMDALVVWSSTTVWAMNDRLLPPANDRSPRPEGVHSLPVVFSRSSTVGPLATGGEERWPC